MEILLRDSDVVSLVLGFLHSRELYESVLALERETGILAPKDESLPQDLKFLRQMALEGKWESFLSFLEPFTHLEDFDANALYYLVLRQRYFEALHAVSLTKNRSEEDGYLKALLGNVRPYCSSEEFRQLSQARHHSDMHDWSVIASRFRCFNSVLRLVGPLYDDDSVASDNGGSGDWRQLIEDPCPDNQLVSVLTSALLHKECVKYCMDRAMGAISPGAGLPSLTTANIGRLNWDVTFDTAWLCWLRSLQQDDIFKQQYEKEDADIKIEHLEKRATPWDLPYTQKSTSKLSSFASLVKQQDTARSHPNAATSQSVQFSSKDRSGRPQHATSVSGPAQAHGRNRSNNNNHEPPVVKSFKSDATSQHIPTVGTGIRGDESMVEDVPRIPTSVRSSVVTQPVSCMPPEDVPAVSDHNSNVIYKKDHTVCSPSVPEGQQTGDLQTIHSPRSCNQENPVPDRRIDKEDRVHQILPEKPLRDSSNFMNGTGDGRAERPPEVADSHAEFLERKKKMKLEHQNFIQELENREKKKEETRKMLWEPHKNGPQETPFEAHGNSAAADTQQIQNIQDDRTTGASASSPHKKSRYVPIEVTEDIQAIRAVSFHPSGLVYAIGSNSKTLRICAVPGVLSYSSSSSSLVPDDYDGKELKPSKVLDKRSPLHKGSIYSLSWNEEGSLIATGSNDKLVKVQTFDVLGKRLGETPKDMQFHRGIVREVLFLGGRGDMLASGGADAYVYTTDCTRNVMVHKLAGHTDNVLSLYDWHNTMLASSSQDKSVRLWDLRAPRCVSIIGVGGSDLCVPTNICVDATNRWLAMGCDNNSIGLYDLAAGKMAIEYKAHKGEVRSVRFNPVKPNCLLSSSYDGTIVLTDVNGLLSEVDRLASVGYHTTTIVKCKDKVVQCRWHPNGEDFASTSVDRTCKLWHRVVER